MRVLARMSILVMLGAYVPCTAGDPLKNFASMNEEQVDAFVRKTAGGETRLAKRMVAISEKFLGISFALSPLGEGPGNPPDSDPLVRFDLVDCVTFIEQTLALALAVNLEEAKSVLRRIRYIGGEVGYLKRKHFMMAQWIPENQTDGFIEDITERIGGDRVEWVSKKFGPGAWQRRKERAGWPELDPGQVPKGVFRLPIIPIDDMNDLLGRIPAGCLLQVVRRDVRNMPVRVTHMGLVVVKDGQRFLRHAARVGFGRVADERLAAFVRRNSAYRKWPVEGFNLQWPTGNKGIQRYDKLP